jgi:hypothetical protein
MNGWEVDKAKSLDRSQGFLRAVHPVTADIRRQIWDDNCVGEEKATET